MSSATTAAQSVDAVRNVRTLYAGDAMASGLDQFLIVALPIFALSALGISATWLGLVMALQYLPALLIAQRVAAAIDRGDRRRFLVGASVLGASLMVALAVMPWFVRGAQSLPVLLSISVGLGLAVLIYQIASTAVAPTVVADRPVAEVLTGQGAVRTVSRMVGMGIAGPAIDGLGGTMTMLVVAVALGVRAAIMGRLAVRRGDDDVPAASAASSGAATTTVSVSNGAKGTTQPVAPGTNPWALAYAEPALRFGLAGMFVLNVGGAIVAGAYFAYTYDMLRLSPTTIGAAMTLGTVSAVLALRWVKRALAELDAGLICAAGGMAVALVTWLIPLAGLEHGLIALVAYHVIFGAASTLVVVMFTVLRQRLVPNHVLGSVASVSSTLNAASLVAGGASASLLLPWLGVVGTLVAGAAVTTLALAAWVALFRLAAASKGAQQRKA
jgi:hypothetical protein